MISALGRAFLISLLDEYQKFSMTLQYPSLIRYIKWYLV